MKYSVSVEIDQPIDTVVSLFNSAENLYEWQEGLKSLEHLGGKPGEPGAQTRMHFKLGKREIVLVETIVENNLPHSFIANYDAGTVKSTSSVRFEKISENLTRYTTDEEFHFKGFMKLMGWLMPGAFKKQTLKNLTAFKNFAESKK